MGLLPVFEGAPVGTVFFNDAVGGTVVDMVSAPASPATVLYMRLVNTTAAAAYLQVFRSAAASVTLGTTAPYWVYRLAANETLTIQRPWCLGADTAAQRSISIAGTTTSTGSSAAVISVQAMTVII